MRSSLALLLPLLLVGVTGCLQTTKTPIQSRTVDFDNKSDESFSMQDNKIQKYLQLHDDFPDEPKYAERLARLFNVKKDYKNALMYLDRARDIDPGNPKYDYIEARVHLGIGNYSAAERAYLNMIEHSGESFAGPQFELGWFYYQTGEPVKAKPRFEKAARIDGSLPDPHYYLGMIALDNKKTKRAIHHLEQYLKLDGVTYQYDTLKALRRLQPELYTYKP